MQRLLSIQFFFLIAFLLICTGCATIQLKQPLIDVLDIKPRSGPGLKFGFDLELKISNPNSIALPVEGLSYSAKINDAPVIQGVTQSVPTIPAYGSVIVVLSSDVSILSAPRLMLELADNRKKSLSYSLAADIELKGFLPGFSLEKSGELPFYSE